MLQKNDFKGRMVRQDSNQFSAAVSPEANDTNSVPFCVIIHNNE